MANTKKTKALLAKALKKLEVEESDQQKIVDDLKKKLVHAQQYYDDAFVKLTETKSTIADFKKDKAK